MARRITKKPPKHLRNLSAFNQELEKIEGGDISQKYPSFLGNQRQFVDRLYNHLPDLAERLVSFLQATPERITSSNGTTQLLVPPDVALTDGQLQMYKLILQKGLPNQQPVNINGDQTQRNEGKVHITINQSGPDIDFAESGKVIDGVQQGQASQIGTLRFKKPAVVN